MAYRWLLQLLPFILSTPAYAVCTSIPASVSADDAMVFLLPASGVGANFSKKAARTEAPAGALVFDASDGKFKLCNGTSWLVLSDALDLSAPLPTSFIGDYSWGADTRPGKGGLTPVGGNDDAWFSTTRWKEIALGGTHSCAIRDSDSRIFCWGSNSNGQLGDGTTTSRSQPTPLSSTGGWNSTAWKAVFLGTTHSCAIRDSDSRLFCWGSNTFGALGDGTTTSRSVPTELTLTGSWNTTAWLSASAGSEYTCAIRTSDQRLFCWGLNVNGQLGDGTTTHRSQPTALASSGGWDAIAWNQVSVRSTTCAIRQSDSRLFCWGFNAYGEVGDGTTTDRNTPTALTSSGGWNTVEFNKVSVGGVFVCGRRTSNSTLVCWGRNHKGQLGDNSTTDRLIPGALTTTGGWSTTQFAEFFSGLQRICAIVSSTSQMACWGDNTNGELGDGTTTDRLLPTSLTTTSNWNSTAWVNVGVRGHVCAIRANDRRLFCWGDNTSGQLGDGTTISRSTPGALTNQISSAAPEWSLISAGESHNCALRSSDSTMRCWGNNGNGRLGDGTLSDSAVPLSLTTTDGWNATVWSAISGADIHTCAIRSSDSRIFCWGGNGGGRNGNGLTSNSQLTPGPLAGAWETTAWSALSNNSASNCAIRSSDSYLFCWGSNSSSQLGDGTAISRSEPTALSSSGGWDTTTWSMVSNGQTHTCAIRSSDSRLFCWGANDSGQLGDGTTDLRAVPTALVSAGGWDVTAWSSVAAGKLFTCAIRSSDSRVFCWGTGSNGRLGSGSTTGSLVPQALNSVGGWDVTAWAEISNMDDHSCARRSSDNFVFCWGRGGYGKLGDDSGYDRTSPTALSGDFSTTAWTSVRVGGDHTCALRASDSQLFCWGQATNGEIGDGQSSSNRLTPTRVGVTGGFDSIPWLQVSGGIDFICGIRADDETINCWGDGSNGELGNGSGSELNPGPLSTTDNWNTTQWSQISGRGSHSCAIRKSDARLFCWGRGGGGRLGTGNTSSSSVPVALDSVGGWNLMAWKQVAAAVSNAGTFTCAIRASDSQIFCWGSNTAGQLGDGTTDARFSPTALAGGFAMTAWEQVITGEYHTCAIRAIDRNLFCWGVNGNGRLGNGLTGGNSLTPQPLATGFDTTAWSQVTAGESHTCALRQSDRRLFCWGSNSNGQIGIGTTSTSVVTPANPQGGFNTTAWKFVYAGVHNTCAIRASDDQIFCWGRNSNGGVLGVGDITNKLVPTPLAGAAASLAFREVHLGQIMSLAIPKASGASQSCAGGDWLQRLSSTNLVLQMKANAGQISVRRRFNEAARSGTLVYKEEEASLSFCSDGQWKNLSATIGSACSSYPTGGANDGVLSLFNTGKLGLFTRTSGPVPTKGSLIYNSTTSRLQYCDGENWWVVGVD